MKKVAVGIDFGTTNSRIAVFRDGEAKILKNCEGERFTPSCVSFDTGMMLIGKDALEHGCSRNKIYDIRKIIGLGRVDAEAVAEKNEWPFNVTGLLDTVLVGPQAVDTGIINRRFEAVEICALIFEELKVIAMERLDCTEISAVITVPTNFTPKRRAAIEDAAKVAGIDVLQLVDEPSAAAIAYRVLGNPSIKDYIFERNVLVFDLGGATLDVTVIGFCGRRFIIKGYVANNNLGGKKFIRHLASKLEKEIKFANKVHVLGENLREEIHVKAKEIHKELACSDSTWLDFKSGEIRYSKSISPEELREINRTLYSKIESCVIDTLRQAKTEASKIHDVLLIGGCVGFPHIRTMLQSLLRRASFKCAKRCDEMIAKGASIIASHLSGEYDTGISRLNFTKRVPCSLRTDIANNVTGIIISRNALLPARETRSYKLPIVQQTTKIGIQVFQGESDTLYENEFIGHLNVHVIPQNVRVTILDVTYEIGKSSLLFVTAVQRGNENSFVATVLDLAESLKEAAIEEQREKLRKLRRNLPTTEGNDAYAATVRREEVAVEEIDANTIVTEVYVTRSARMFYESHLNDALVYTVDQHREKGRVLIINNEFKGKEKERKGSLVDLRNQADLWRGLGFRVVAKKNLGGIAMSRAVVEFARDSESVSIVSIIIMTHGGNEDGKDFLEGEDGRCVYVDDVISLFDANHAPHLHGIPKLFFFQACRGSSRDLGIATDSAVTKYPLKSDMLVAYPSQTGFTSVRHAIEGSWLMNAVTNVFMRNAHNCDILGLMTMVNNEVSKKETRFGHVQMPNQVNALRKKLFLFPGWPSQ